MSIKNYARRMFKKKRKKRKQPVIQKQNVERSEEPKKSQLGTIIVHIGWSYSRIDT